MLSLRPARQKRVAPHVGAWIETSTMGWLILCLDVAPHVGAWIETQLCDAVDIGRKSHPTWVRGLKPGCRAVQHGLHPVAPHVGAWIETVQKITVFSQKASHPTWVRGLKPTQISSPPASFASHPTWVRGLKQKLLAGTIKGCSSHPTWVRGLKPEIDKYLQRA